MKSTLELIPLFKEKLRVQTEYNEKVIDREITRMLEQKIIKPSSSPYATNLLVVSKPDPSEPTGVKDRVCVAYVRLNTQTVKDTYPLPVIQQLFYKVCKAKWFTAMDLMSGFWQVAIKPEHRHKTAFITARGLYEFLVMPFGLCNAPSTFQRMMDQVIEPQYRSFVQTYIDDILIYSDTFEQHLQHIEKVFDLFIKHKLTVKLSKCKFFQMSVKFLGHMISQNSISVNPAIIDVIKKWIRPDNSNKKTFIKAIRSFLGTVGWFRKFIPHFADLAKPLYDLTKIDASLEWLEVHQKSFEQLRDALVTAPVLLAPDLSKDFILQSDASDFAMGVILMQNDSNNHLRPCGYYSRTFTAAQRNYSPTEREALALVEGLEHFKQLLHGHKYVACTDHNALTYIYKNQNSTPRLTRYFLRLTPFELTVQYKKGSENTAADLLSRHQQLMVSNNVTRVNRKPGEEEYEVERIMNRRKIANTIDEYEYLVKWRNYPLSECSWQPLSNLHNCIDLVIQYNTHEKEILDSIKLQTSPSSPTIPGSPSTTSLHNDNADEVNKSCSTCKLTFNEASEYYAHMLRMHDIHTSYTRIIPTIMEITPLHLSTLQRSDKELKFIFDYLKDNKTINSNISSVQKHLLITKEFAIGSDNILYMVDTSTPTSANKHTTHLRVCIPTSLRSKLLSYVHTNLLSSHAGVVHTYDKLCKFVWWPRLVQDVIQQVNQCPVCARVKPKTQTSSLQPTMVPSYPWQVISVDIVGPLPVTTRGNQYLLTITDIFSKYGEAIPLRDATTTNISDAIIEHIICRHGLPEVMVSDRGGPFISDLARSIYKHLSIRRITTSSFHPQSNIVERFHKTFNMTLRLWCNEQQNNWDSLIHYARFAYNTEYHRVIKECPYYVIHGRIPRTPLDCIIPINKQQNANVHEYVNIINQQLINTFNRIKAIYNQVNENRENINDSDASATIQYKPGDKVYLWDPTSRVCRYT